MRKIHFQLTNELPGMLLKSGVYWKGRKGIDKCKMHTRIFQSLSKVVLRIQIASYKNRHRYIKNNIGNIANTIVMTIYDFRWVLDLSGDHVISHTDV